MIIRLLLVLLLLATPLISNAQTERLYSIPQMTLEVKELLDARTVWQGVSSRLKTDLPQSVDNSLSEYFPPVISQQGGSCAQASGVGYVFTYEMNRILDRNASANTDHQYAYLYTWNFLNGGKDEGGFVTQGFNILKGYGGMSSSDFGTISTYSFKWATGYDRYLRAMRSRIKETYLFDVKTDDDIEQIKAYLYDKGDGQKGGGLLCFSSYSSGWEMDDEYAGPSLTGYTSVLTNLATDGAHALTIVGYDDLIESKNIHGELRTGAFIVVNTWGEYAYGHDRGRYYMPYHFFTEREDGVYNEAILTTDVDGISVMEYEPQVVMRVEMSHTSRDDISIEYGVSSRYTSNIPQSTLRLPIVANQGGDHPMQGRYVDNAESLEFAVDFSPFVHSEAAHPKQYILNVMMGGRGTIFGEGQVKRVRLYDYRQDSKNPIIYEASTNDCRVLTIGENYIPIIPMPISASECRTKSRTINTYVVRKANGDFSKMEVDATDFKKNKLKLRYKYNQNGGSILE